MNLAYNFLTSKYKEKTGKKLAFYLRYFDYICFILGVAAPVLMIVEISLQDNMTGN